MFTKKDVGCFIDGSAMSAEWINKEVIQFAEKHGFELHPMDSIPSEDDEDYEQILSEIADEAVEYLSDSLCDDEACFIFEDNSLFLVCVGEDVL
jgi:hypothetical protein